jgi:hypothetical protein
MAAPSSLATPCLGGAAITRSFLSAARRALRRLLDAGGPTRLTSPARWIRDGEVAAGERADAGSVIEGADGSLEATRRVLLEDELDDSAAKGQWPHAAPVQRMVHAGPECIGGGSAEVVSRGLLPPKQGELWRLLAVGVALRDGDRCWRTFGNSACRKGLWIGCDDRPL